MPDGGSVLADHNGVAHGLRKVTAALNGGLERLSGEEVGALDPPHRILCDEAGDFGMSDSARQRVPDLGFFCAAECPRWPGEAFERMPFFPFVGCCGVEIDP